MNTDSDCLSTVRKLHQELTPAQKLRETLQEFEENNARREAEGEYDVIVSKCILKHSALMHEYIWSKLCIETPRLMHNNICYKN